MEWDDTLTLKLKNGDATALELCYRRLSPFIYTAILKICGNRELAKDLTHDTFIDVFNSVKKIDGNLNIGAWAKRIAFNNTFNYLKREKSAQKLLLEVSGEGDLFYCPTDKVIENNLLDVLFSKVPNLHRLILWLYVVEGYSHDEIGELTGNSASFSKSIVSRCLQKLRDKPEVKNNAYQ